MNHFPFHSDGRVPCPADPNRRRNALMREFVELVSQNVDAGQITIGRAAQLMDKVGVPFEVACRLLPKRRPQ